MFQLRLALTGTWLHSITAVLMLAQHNGRSLCIMDLQLMSFCGNTEMLLLVEGVAY